MGRCRLVTTVTAAAEDSDGKHTDDETEFLDASQRQADSERDELTTRARLDARRNRRLQALLVAASLLLAVSLVAGLLAVRSERAARDQRDVARSAENTARDEGDAARLAEGNAQLESLTNRSLALRSTDRDVAALLAVEAAQRWPDDPRATSALMGTFTAARGFLGYQYVPDADRTDGAPVPGTSTAVISADGERLALFDFDTGQIDERFPPFPDLLSVLDVRVSADGRFVVATLLAEQNDGCFDLAALLATDGRGCASFAVYDVASGELILQPVTTPFGPGDVAISDDGSLVAVTGGYDGDLAVYRTDNEAEVGTMPGLPRPAGVDHVRDTAAVSFGPDDLVYVGSMGGPIRVVDPDDLDIVGTIDAPALSSNKHLAVGADGIVVGGGHEALVAADTSSGSIRWTVDIRGTYPDPCPWFAASDVVGRLYCGNFFGVIEERDRSTGQRTGVTLDPQLGRVGSLAISADGRELAAFGDEAPAIDLGTSSCCACCRDAARPSASWLAAQPGAKRQKDRVLPLHSPRRSAWRRHRRCTRRRRRSRVPTRGPEPGARHRPHQATTGADPSPRRAVRRARSVPGLCARSWSDGGTRP